jgi:branched-chain amino acid transport system ATP-binding protein
VLSGLQRASAGAVWLGSERLDGLPPDRICELGLVHVPEGRLLFPTMTVLENLEMGAYGRRARGAQARNLERVFALFPVLSERRHQESGTLSGGEQQMLAITRALMSGPQVLMLDEPSLGLAPLLAAEIFKALQVLNHEGLTVLLVSQEVPQALRIAHRGYVLENGRIVLSQAGPELLRNERVVTSYLGI